MIKRKPKGTPSDANRESRVAIDVGFYSIKLAYLKDHLLHLDEFPLFDQPKDFRTFKEQEIATVQISAINKAVNMTNPKAEFILSPPPSQQILTRVLVPPPDMELRRYLEKEFPFEPDLLCYDTNSLEAEPKGKKARKSEKKSPRLGVTATDLDLVHRSVGLLGEFQLQIKRVTPDVVSLVNYVILASDGEPPEPVLLLDLGALHTHLIIFKARGHFLARTLGVGGNHLNQELVEKLNVDFETADRIKRERKLIDDGLFDSKGTSTSMPMFQAINSVLFGLVDEIKHSMTFFEDSFLEDLGGASILLTGGGSVLHNLDRFLARELDLPVRKADNPLHALPAGNSFAPQFASVVGLLGLPARPGLLDISLIRNIDGMLFKLHDGDYYLTKEGFVNKKRYRKKRFKSEGGKPSVRTREDSGEEEIGLPPLAYFKALPAKITALFKGEKIEMPRMKISLGELGSGPIREHLKIVIIVLGALFLLLYAGERLLWAPKKRVVDRAAASYLNKQVEVDRMRASVRRGVLDPDRENVALTGSDKILWAAKLRTIASAIPETVWISDLAIQGAPPALVLSCHVSSYGQDHLTDIARFIENLKGSEVFLKDFGDVVFRSAQRSAADKDIYDFTLTFPLKRRFIEETAGAIKRGG